MKKQLLRLLTVNLLSFLAMNLLFTNSSFAFQVISTPTAITTVLHSQNNPNGNLTVAIPSTAFGGAVPGMSIPINSIRITAFPTNTDAIVINGTSYVSTTFPGTGVIIPAGVNGQPTQSITIDPIDGAVTSVISYRTRNGLESSLATVSASFTVGGDPFVCEDIAYVVKGTATESTLYKYAVNSSTPLESFTGLPLINALAYNPKDNFLYGVAGIYEDGNISDVTNSNGTRIINLIRIYNNGNILRLTVPNLVMGRNSASGSITGDGYYVIPFLGATNENRYYTIDMDPARSTFLQIVDPTTPIPHSISNTYKTASANLFPLLADYAYNSADGLMYGVNNVSNITTFNYRTGVVTSSPTKIKVGGEDYPAGANPGAYFDRDKSRFFVIRGDGNFYAIDIASEKAVLLAGTGTSTNTDATTCTPNNLTYLIQGNVFDDVNGTKDIPTGIVNGNAYAGPVLYALLYDNISGKVVSVGKVGVDGSYGLGLDPSAVGNYAIHLTKNIVAVGDPLPLQELHPGWVYTGENVGINAAPDAIVNGIINLGVVNGDINNANFGIEQPPSQVGIGTNPATNTFNAQITVSPSTFTNTQNSVDATAVTGIRITEFPTNVNNITINGVVYTNTPASIALLTSLIIPTDANGNPTQTITVDPTATANVVISFKAIDAAGLESNATGTATLLISNTPPVSNDATVSCVVNPGGTTKVAVSTITGTDVEDGVYDGTNATTNKFVITAIGTNGKLYFNNVLVQVGNIITPYTTSSLTVDPDSGIPSFSFNYKHIDADNLQADNAGTATINFSNPISLISGEATLCKPSTGNSFYVTSLPVIPTTYNWTYTGTGATIIGNGSPNITINFDATATAGTLNLTATNACETFNRSTPINFSAGFYPPPDVLEVVQPTCTKPGTIFILPEEMTGGSVYMNDVFYEGTYFENLAPGTYVFSLGLSSCYPRITVVLNPLPPSPATPIISTTTPTTFCAGGSVLLTSSATTGNQWFKDGTLLAGETGQTYSATTPGNYTVVVTIGGGCSFSVPTTVTVNAASTTPTISTTTPTTFCAGGSVLLTSSSAIGNQWYRDGGILVGETGQIYSATTPGNYTVVVTTGACPSLPSAPTNVTIGTPTTPTISTTTPTTFCAGGSVLLTSSSATGNQWYRNGGILLGETGQTYSATTAGDYTVIATAGACPSLASAATTVTVNAIPATPTISTTTPTTFCAGGSVLLTSSSATGNQWYRDGGILAGETGQTYSATTAGNYTVIVTTSGCPSLASAATTVTINAIPATPTISTTTPTTFCAGGSVLLTSSSATGNQWYRDGSILVGETNQTYSATTAGNYTVVVTAGGCPSLASAATTVTVNAVPATPTISTTTATTFCAGGSVLLSSSSATGNQWYLNGGILAGETGQTYSATTAGNYTVIVTTSGCPSLASAATTVTVNAIPATPTISTTTPTTFCAGGSVLLTSSSATGNQWYRNGGILVGETGQTYSATTAGNYTVIVTTSGCPSLASAATTVTVNAIPAIPTISTTTPTTFCAGGSVLLTSSSATGNQWYRDGGILVGETGQTYSATTAGNYTVIVTTSGCPSLASAATTVTVNVIPPTPTVSTTTPTTFCAGGSVLLTSSSATGNQWYRDGSILVGETNQTYSATTAGNYTVVVTAGGCPSLASAATTVTVNTIPALPIVTVTSQPDCTTALGTISITPVLGVTYSVDGSAYTALTNYNLATGSHTIIARSASGCLSPATVVNINSIPGTAASINYNGPYCVGNGVKNVTRTGEAGGNYTSSTGLSLDPITGSINTNLSLPGTYTVTYSFSSGLCANSTTATVTINALPTASISYAGPFVTTGTAVVAQSGQTGGTYSSTTGLVINPNTGTIDLAQSKAGTYTITYNYTNGTCTGTTSTTVTIAEKPAEKITNLSVQKIINNAAPIVGSNVVFTILASNMGPNDATGVSLTDVLPIGYTFVSSTVTTGVFSNANGLWNIGNLASGTSATLTITAKVNAAGPYANTATIKGNEPDPELGNNTSTVTPAPIAGTVNLSIQKTTTNTSVNIGDTYDYTIVVRNIGSLAATEVTATDVLPEGITYVSSSVTSGTASYAAATRTLTWNIGSLAVGTTTTLTLKVSADRAGAIKNTATVIAKEVESIVTDNTAVASSEILGFNIPNVITPNGDGKNDTFFIDGLGAYPEHNLIIFNRWNNEVYNSHGNYKNNWTGEGLNDGTYYYLLKVKNNSGALQALTGHITLLRKK